jgi:ankyrin repeat protein
MTLDETYERILLEIDEEKRSFTHRLLQCLVISIRPLLVEELAELFAIFPNADSTPSFNVGWRPEDPEAFVLSTCSTLVAIVKVSGKKVVQFSHFSVREYLTSARIANSAYVSHFHILPKPAHTLLARACLCVLLRLDYSIDGTKIQNSPLAEYAAEHWVDHIRFEDVSSDVQDGVDCLFDRNKPHLAAWIRLYDVEHSRIRYDRPPNPALAVPLYYAALCGIRDLVERLLGAHPQDLNTQGGYYNTPLLAALNKEHLNIALFLLEHGADVEQRDGLGQTALYMASSRGYIEAVRPLIHYGADPNVLCGNWEVGWREVELTPLLVALVKGKLEIARLLLEIRVDVERRGSPGQTALYMASSRGYVGLVRSLLDCGADPNAVCDDWDDDRDDVRFTALLVASQKNMLEVARLLLEQGADPNYEDNYGRSALHLVSRHPSSDLARLLLDHGANPNAVHKQGHTALHEASLYGRIAVVALLLEYGANVNARDKDGWTPLHCVASEGYLELVQLLLDYDADVNAKTGDRSTALHLAALYGYHQVEEALLEHGTNPQAPTDKGEAPFQVALGSQCVETTQVRRQLSEYTGEGMEDVGMRD